MKEDSAYTNTREEEKEITHDLPLHVHTEAEEEWLDVAGHKAEDILPRLRQPVDIPGMVSGTLMDQGMNRLHPTSLSHTP